jgi:Zn-dependent metalloprotease
LEKRVRELKKDRALEEPSVDFRAQRAQRAQLWQEEESSRAISATNAQNVYTAQGREQLPGRLAANIARQAHKSTNRSVEPCWDNSQLVIEFYEKLFGINLQRYLGGQVESSVDFAHEYNNAFFDGHQMVYGTGDGTYFKDFCFDLSVVTHELGHAVVDSTVPLIYEGQSGALNESYADVFAIALQQKQKGLPVGSLTQADWVIGERCVVGEHAALRSFTEIPARPADHPLGPDDLPRHMKDLYRGDEDNGGVHINSSIINHAFYRLVTKSQVNSWKMPLQLWASLLLQRKIKTNSTFDEFATALREQAKASFPALASAVDGALNDVGLIELH